jgi:hypothetical protein
MRYAENAALQRRVLEAILVRVFTRAWGQGLTGQAQPQEDPGARVFGLGDGVDQDSGGRARSSRSDTLCGREPTVLAASPKPIPQLRVSDDVGISSPAT